MPNMMNDISKINSHKKNMKKKPYISEPIAYTHSANTVYRWDSRSPEIIEKEGFTGSPKSFFNMIFGKKTVFTANDREGSQYYFQELENGMSRYGDSETYYLYEIYTAGIPSVPLFGREGEEKKNFAKALATREPGIANYKAPFPEIQEYLELMRLPPPAYMDHAVNYINGTANMNHEVQLCGPIPPSKIRYVGKRTLSEPSKILRKQLIAGRK